MSNIEPRVSKRRRSGGYARQRVDLYAIVVIAIFVAVVGLLFALSYMLDPTTAAQISYDTVAVVR